MPEKPRRRWFAFRLRTLLILVAITAPVLAWAGYSLKWIEHRHAFMHKSVVGDYEGRGAPRRTPPGLLWIFGERAVVWIYCHPGDGPEARRLFPEAIYIREDLSTVR
ncbi:MAG TPA: hypothetical protein VGG30_01525 [Pirellulales bacterium]|jgi:hypothetical protein